jgi:PadR family transcriptional regulator
MSSSGRQVEVGQPKRFLQPCLLLLIAESPAHGYDLLERLAAFGFERDPGGLYRALRSMEGEGLVRSEWQLSTAGPGRRCYELTGRGHQRLQAWAEGLLETRHVVETYLQRYHAVEEDLRAAEQARAGR